MSFSRSLKRPADFPQTQSAEESQQHGLAVIALERAQRLIEYRLKFLPSGIRGIVRRIHVDSSGLPRAASGLAPAKVPRQMARALVQPSCERSLAGHAAGLACKQSENILRHFLREGRFPDMPQRRGIHQPGIARDDFAKRLLAAVADILLEQVMVIIHGVTHYVPARLSNRTENSRHHKASGNVQPRRYKKLCDEAVATPP